MACFVVSLLGAAGVGIAKHFVKKHERKLDLKKAEVTKPYKFGDDIKWSKKLSYLELSLYSGSFLLAIEHAIHGEIVPYPPFFTALSDSSEAIEMFQEMGTVGVLMFVSVVLAWCLGVFVADLFKYKTHKKKVIEAK